MSPLSYGRQVSRLVMGRARSRPDRFFFRSTKRDRSGPGVIREGGEGEFRRIIEWIQTW